MPQTSKEERARWAELCAKATPGPMRVDNKIRVAHEGGKHGYREILAEGTAVWIARVQAFTDGPIDPASPEWEANAYLFAAARTALPRLLADYDELERKVREFCIETDRVLILARQLVDGWYNTTPANEWSEFDESTRTEMRELHGKAVALRAAIGGEK